MGRFRPSTARIASFAACVLHALSLVELSAHSVPQPSAANDRGRQVNIPTLRNLRFVVRGIEEGADADGPVGRVFVKQQGSSKEKCTQEQLDAWISQGNRPDLEFENSALANHFFVLRENKTQIELHLDKRAQSSSTTKSVAGKRHTREEVLPETPPHPFEDAAMADVRSLDVESDKSYLQSYASLSVHETMIKDRSRTEWFMREIEDKKELFADKVVLDVGTGTGILALFAARAGARKVYAVECSEIAGLARQLVIDNGFNETVSVLKGNVEEVHLPEKVDIIVSEWMGFYLLHESMITSVISARDRFLKPGGLILPSAAKLFAAPVNLAGIWDDRVGFWQDAARTYGLDMRAAAELAQRNIALSPLIEDVNRTALLAEGQLLWSADMRHVQASDVALLSSQLEFNLPAGSIVHGLCLWFEVFGAAPSSPLLSTAPGSAPTHWKQTLVFLGQEVVVEGGESKKIGFDMTIMQESRRQYALALELFDPEKHPADVMREDDGAQDGA